MAPCIWHYKRSVSTTLRLHSGVVAATQLGFASCSHARVLVGRSAKDAPLSVNEPEPVLGIHRRHALAWASLCVGLPQLPATAAAAASLEEYRDEADAFTIQVPRGWNFAVPQQPYDRFRAGTSSVRTLVWYPEESTETNITAVINTPSADYTSLSSFGNAADFGSNLVNSMDRSFTLPKNGKPPSEPVMVSKVLNTASRESSYFTEYSIEKLLPGGGSEPKKLFYSRVSLGSNGRMRRFYTFTATCPEARAGDVLDTLKAAVDSVAFASAGPVMAS